MTTEQKLALIEKALGIAPHTLKEDTHLSTVPEWDSLSILNLQIELTAVSPDLQFDNLYQCMSVDEILKMF